MVAELDEVLFLRLRNIGKGIHWMEGIKYYETIEVY